MFSHMYAIWYWVSRAVDWALKEQSINPIAPKAQIMEKKIEQQELSPRFPSQITFG